MNQDLRNLRAENDLLRSRLSLLSELSRRISHSLELEKVLQAVVDGACDLTGARYGALGVFDEEGTVQEFLTHGISKEEREGIGSLPRGLGLLGWLHEKQAPVRLSDLSKHPCSVGFPPNHPPMKTFLGAPIRFEGEALGNLYLTEKMGELEFTPEDEDLLVLFAGQAALAIRNARLHEMVEQERRRLNTIFDSSPDGIIYIQTWTGRIELNKRAEELLGISPSSEDTVEVLENLWHTPDGNLVQWEDHPVTRALKGEVLVGEEYLITHPFGSHKPVLCSAAPIQSQGEGISGAVIQLQDMTLVKQAYQRVEELAAERGRLLSAAEEERQQLESLVQTSPVGVFVVETETGKLLTINQEAQRILGFSGRPEDDLRWYEQNIIYRRTDGSLYEPEELPLQRAITRGETVRAEEIRFELPDGRSVPTLVNATPVYGADGKISAGIAVIQDMTPVEELEKLRSEFLGMISHELKTPLTAIKGSAATVLGSKRPFDPEETHELFEIIDEQADRLRDLVDNLLDMTRIEAGTLSVSTDAVDIREVIERAKATFERTGVNHQIVVELDQNLPPVKADRRRIEQVLSNLLSNAAKFSPEIATVRLLAQETDGQVVVSVVDQGRGIPQGKMPFLFRKFSRLHEDGGRKHVGTGLGLAICKGIVEAHGGRIWAESKGEGAGSTFSFSLPVVEKVATLETILARRGEHMGQVHKAGERTRILAVDDEIQIVRYLKRALDEAGYHPTVTTDPQQVIPLIEKEEPDLVLMDVMLPGTTGFELLERVREFSGVPVVFLTARDESEDAAKALRMGADDYITKPFAPSELLARIEAVMRRRVLPDLTEVRKPYVLEGLTINFAERRVTLEEKSISLSSTEYKLLYELAINAGRVLTHDQILQRVWGPEYAGEPELVRSFVRNLRRKLGDDARNPKFIFTEPQVGYRMPNPSD